MQFNKIMENNDNMPLFRRRSERYPHIVSELLLLYYLLYYFISIVMVAEIN